MIGRFQTRARQLIAALLKEKLEPGRAAAAVFVGIFIGIVPIYGFQTLAAVGAALLFRLNKPLTVAGTFINNPLLQPAIIVSSVEIGYFLRDGSFRAFHLSALTGAHMKEEMLAFVIGSVVLATWGPWPAWKTLKPNTPMAIFGIMQLFAQKIGLLVDTTTVCLGLLVAFFGTRYGTGWRGHAQRIAVGLSTASLAQLAVQIIWEIIAKATVPHSMEEYQRVVGLREKLFNANSVVYLLVTIWWIACLWIDEPGPTSTDEAAPTDVAAAEEAPTAFELPRETAE